MHIAQFKTDSSIRPYIGRFAPSPTGPLHLGSLVAAMASYLDARAHQGKWLLRIEDLDPPREVPGSADSIISSLDRLGFEWDESISYQSHRHALYDDAIEALFHDKLAYACKCSRREIAELQPVNATSLRYTGYCRQALLKPVKDRAIRAVTEDSMISFNDRITGNFTQNVEAEIGDFVIRRKDGYFAYQLAVVVDDAEQKISHVVRGVDLLDSTPRQIHLQKLLSFTTPWYAHTPLVMDENGYKFSKSSHHGRPLQFDLPTLIEAWHFLHQTQVRREDFDTIPDFWQWAITQWDINKLVN